MLRSAAPWRWLGGRRLPQAPFSARAWYQMLQEQRSLEKPAADSSSRVSILGPARPLGREELLRLLESSLVYAEGELVAISKPPGLPVTGNPGELTLLSLLPHLSQKLGLPENLQVIKAARKEPCVGLHSTPRIPRKLAQMGVWLQLLVSSGLDLKHSVEQVLMVQIREASGLVLLSSCQDTIQRLQNFYVQRQKARHPVVTYCAVTTRIPATLEGEVHTGLKLMRVEDCEMVVPVASPSRNSLLRKEVKNTLTHFRVLDSCNGCALLQLQPLTAFPSQLLVHLTLILSPALGDHVYSSRVGTVLEEPFLLPAESTLPRVQVLDDFLLGKLHLQQQQVYRLPLHLHLHQLILPAGGSSASSKVLTAPLPSFFLQTLNLLGLTLPQVSDKQ